MWVLYLMAAAGMSVILVVSRIARPIRDLLPPPMGLKGLPPHNPCNLDEEAAKRPAALLGCCLCTGFWTGLLFGLMHCLRHVLPGGWCLLPDVIAFAFAGSIASYIAFAWLCHVKAP